MKDRALIIFIKNPEPGKVKTRLARSVGDERALAIYRRLLAHTRRVALGVDAERLLYYSRFIDHKDDWAASEFQKHRQQGSDLGVRMEQALTTALLDHSKAVIIGSDCAELHPELIEEAFRRLDDHDLVVGPATDGGYYLLGLTAPAPSLFRQMTWSTAEVLAETLQRAARLNYTCFLLPELSDIDTEADWKRIERGQGMD